MNKLFPLLFLIAACSETQSESKSSASNTGPTVENMATDTGAPPADPGEQLDMGITVSSGRNEVDSGRVQAEDAMVVESVDMGSVLPADMGDIPPDQGQAQTDAAMEAADANQTGPAPTIWRGPKITFTKEPGADSATAEAQDRITDQIILTRGPGNVLYNIAQENGPNQAVSPAGTLWSLGTTDNLDELQFEPLKVAANNRMKLLPNRDIVLHLVEENIYIDVRFISWGVGRNGGGAFSYERSTPNQPD